MKYLEAGTQRLSSIKETHHGQRAGQHDIIGSTGGIKRMVVWEQQVLRKGQQKTAIEGQGGCWRRISSTGGAHW